LKSCPGPRRKKYRTGCPGTHSNGSKNPTKLLLDPSFGEQLKQFAPWGFHVAKSFWCAQQDLTGSKPRAYKKKCPTAGWFNVNFPPTQVRILLNISRSKSESGANSSSAVGATYRVRISNQVFLVQVLRFGNSQGRVAAVWVWVHPSSLGKWFQSTPPGM